MRRLPGRAPSARTILTRDPLPAGPVRLRPGLYKYLLSAIRFPPHGVALQGIAGRDCRLSRRERAMSRIVRLRTALVLVVGVVLAGTALSLGAFAAGPAPDRVLTDQSSVDGTAAPVAGQVSAQVSESTPALLESDTVTLGYDVPDSELYVTSHTCVGVIFWCRLCAGDCDSDVSGGRRGSALLDDFDN